MVIKMGTAQHIRTKPMLWGVWEHYLLSWRGVWRPRILATMAIDVLLLISLFATAILYSLFSGLITHPLIPFLKSVQSGVAPPHALMNGAIVKLLFLFSVALFIAALFYSLAKRYSYDLLARENWSWRRWRASFSTTLALLSSLIIISLITIFINPVVAAYVFVALLILFLELLPLLYIKPFVWWLNKCRDPFPLLAIWLLPFLVLALLFFVHSFSILSAVFLILAASAFSLAIIFTEPWTRQIVSAFALLFATWLAGSYALLALSLLSVWTAVILSVLWLLLFVAFGRLFLNNVAGGFL